MKTRSLLAPPMPWDDLRANEAATGAIRELAKRELARRDFLEFVQAFTPNYEAGWVHREVADLLDAFAEAVEQKKSPRLMIFLPPGHGKSQLVSRLYPPYLLGKHPDWELATATYNQELADVFGRYVRDRLVDPLYLDLFPVVQVDPRSAAVDRVDLLTGGKYLAVGIGGSLTGRRAHVLTIDDPVKDRADADSPAMRRQAWDWYSSTARTRLYPGGGVIVLQTRWHEEDLAGMLLQHAKDHPDGDQWLVYEYPAIATKDEKHRRAGEALHPERYSDAELRRIKSSMQPRDWSALYQQNPVPDEGIYFKRDTIKTYAVLPENVYYYGGSDLAISERTEADFTVHATGAVDEQDTIYITPDLVHARLDGFEIVEKLLDLFQKLKPMYWAMEAGHISKAIGPQLRKRMSERKVYTSLWDHTPHKDKMARARSLQARMQQGKVLFHTSIMDLILPEFLAFPAGKHDDLVDAIASICLMLDAIVAPRPLPDVPDDKIVPGSWEDLKRRTKGTPRFRDPDEKNPHRPTSLFVRRKPHKEH